MPDATGQRSAIKNESGCTTPYGNRKETHKKEQIHDNRLKKPHLDEETESQVKGQSRLCPRREIQVL